MRRRVVVALPNGFTLANLFCGIYAMVLSSRGGAADLDRAEIEALMAAAVKIAKLRLDANSKGSVILKAESQKKRALRAKKTARPAPARRTSKARR